MADVGGGSSVASFNLFGSIPPAYASGVSHLVKKLLCVAFLFQSHLKMLSSSAFLGYAFPKSPLFLQSPPFAFLLSLPSFLKLRFCFHSHSPDPNSLRDSVASFNRLLSMTPPPSIIEIDKILGSLAKTNHSTTAISLYAQAELKGFKPSFVTLNILINCYCHVGDITSAFSSSGKDFKRGHRPDMVTMNTLMTGLCMKDVGQALDFHDDLLTKGFCLKLGYLWNDVNESIAVFNKMIKADLTPTVPNTVTYSSLIDGLCKAKRMSHVKDLVYEMRHNGHDPDIITYSIILDAFCKMRHLDEAIALYQEIVREYNYSAASLVKFAGDIGPNLFAPFSYPQLSLTFTRNGG
ncbi:pentatricopeptide repeat-containing protein At1g63080, mitochondrial-like [Neltuma alba]|uniref:pentatricopeptide repeat-containing protein At1g63080, mitochondrial-like n=1 Tax=Neltuma alba TaxID=207710 RepID=UPI0010A3A670|nr:pentatricopeptide repeat-containing protein At1g63080, mitochondrial-like [Prosopis alba]